MEFVTKTSRTQRLANKLIVYLLKIFRFNTNTFAQNAKDIQVDYVIFNKGKIKWSKSPV